MKDLMLLMFSLIIGSVNVISQPLSSPNVNYDIVDSITYSNKNMDYVEIINLIKTDSVLSKNKLNQTRAVSVWICDNITYQVDLFNYDSQLNLNQILKVRKGSCNAYAFLFKSMCDSIGVECEKITGLTKQDGYLNIGYHAWNVININNQQVLIDVTWMNSNDMDGYYDDNWFNCDPEYFIYTHYPFKYTLDRFMKITDNNNIINTLRTNDNIINGSMEMMNCQNLKNPITMEYFLALPNYIKWTRSDYKPLKPFPVKKMWYLNK